MRTQGNELERAGEYRQVLVQCVHKCAVKYPGVAAGVVHLLMEFLGDSQSVGELAAGLQNSHMLPACRCSSHQCVVIPSCLSKTYINRSTRSCPVLAAPTNTSHCEMLCLVSRRTCIHHRSMRSGALDVAVFVREMMEMHPSMHQSLLQQLRVAFPQLQSSRVYTTVLWMLAEYSSATVDVGGALDTILHALGPAPFTTSTVSMHPLQH
jgi:hypothetical protein